MSIKPAVDVAPRQSLMATDLSEPQIVPLRQVSTGRACDEIGRLAIPAAME